MGKMMKVVVAVIDGGKVTFQAETMHDVWEAGKWAPDALLRSLGYDGPVIPEPQSLFRGGSFDGEADWPYDGHAVEDRGSAHGMRELIVKLQNENGQFALSGNGVHAVMFRPGYVLRCWKRQGSSLVPGYLKAGRGSASVVYDESRASVLDSPRALLTFVQKHEHILRATAERRGMGFRWEAVSTSLLGAEWNQAHIEALGSRAKASAKSALLEIGRIVEAANGPESMSGIILSDLAEESAVRIRFLCPGGAELEAAVRQGRVMLSDESGIRSLDAGAERAVADARKHGFRPYHVVRWAPSLGGDMLTMYAVLFTSDGDIDAEGAFSGRPVRELRNDEFCVLAHVWTEEFQYAETGLVYLRDLGASLCRVG